MFDPIRILVVDDNPAGRYATSHILRGAGWNIVEATTGTEALELATGDVNLVILDVNLPDIDGFEVCRRIRATPQTARMPVIHLSATFVTDVDRIHGLESGADGYLVHPVEPPVLVATVKAFLRARNAEADRERLLLSERAARAEAERANRIKDDFLATLSHELRTPLQAIIGWVQVLKSGKLSSEDMANAVAVIERNATAQAQLIADLLDTSRIISGKLRLDVQPVDPAAMIEEALATVLPAATAKDIRINKILDPAAGAVIGDPARLQQVVWNLVSNAVKFTPKGGKIEVALRRVNSHIEISVADSGQGIDPEVLPRIFDRFQQGDSSSTRAHGGLGLGLAISKQLIELHGGQIAGHSDGPGRGARFTITMPLSLSRTTKAIADQENSAEFTSRFDPVRLDGVRVLLVDDDIDARSMLVRVLGDCGATTRDAANVKDALAAIEEFQPDIVLSDLGMPNHDGFELIRKIRSSGHTVSKLPAIALTGFARREDRHRALLAGFQVHVSKPINPNELTAVIASLVGRTGGM